MATATGVTITVKSAEQKKECWGDPKKTQAIEASSEALVNAIGVDKILSLPSATHATLGKGLWNRTASGLQQLSHCDSLTRVALRQHGDKTIHGIFAKVKISPYAQNGSPTEVHLFFANGFFSRHSKVKQLVTIEESDLSSDEEIMLADYLKRLINKEACGHLLFDSQKKMFLIDPTETRTATKKTISYYSLDCCKCFPQTTTEHFSTVYLA